MTKENTQEPLIHTIANHSKPAVTIALYGPQRPPSLRHLAHLGRARKDQIFLVKTASNQTKLGFKEVHVTLTPSLGLDDKRYDLYADGVLATKPHTGIVMQTADCMVIVLYEITTHRVAIIHFGRPAATPDSKQGQQISNVLTTAYRKLIEGVPAPAVQARFFASIAPEDFRHDDEHGQKLVAAFDQFGAIAFRDRRLGTLDLPAIATAQLVGFGVPSEHIQYIGPYTSQADWLASYRGGGGEQRNATIVVLH